METRHEQKKNESTESASLFVDVFESACPYEEAGCAVSIPRQTDGTVKCVDRTFSGYK